MASPDKDRQRDQLYGYILTAVYNRHSDAIRRAITVFQNLKLEIMPPKKSPGGKHLLDFLPPKSAHVAIDCISHSPLMLACELQDDSLVNTLLELGASAAFKNKERLNALHIACNKGNSTICEYLLIKARSQNNFGKKKQFSSDLFILINAKEKRGWTPLMYAVKGDHLDIAKALVATETVDYQIVNKKHSNFVHIMCREGSIKCLEYFLDHPPPLMAAELKKLFQASDIKEWNLFHHACCFKPKLDEAEDVVMSFQWLCESIPDSLMTEKEKSELLKQKTKVGYSPLLVACDYQKVKTVEYLASMADIDVSDSAEEIGPGEHKGCKSGLHLAAIHDSRDIADVLLKHGCKIDLIDGKGDTALHIAHRNSSEDVAALLESAEGGKLIISIKNLDGQLPQDIQPEDVIPPEIKKRGQVVIDRYRQALRHGKQKIPRCGLLILGEKRKGKTSVYRLVVGKPFNPNQDSTRGIDGNEVDVVDCREITIDWKERGKEELQSERDQAHTHAILNEIQDKMSTPVKQKHQVKFDDISEEDLIRAIEDLLPKRKVKPHSLKPTKPRKTAKQNELTSFFDPFMEEAAYEMQSEVSVSSSDSKPAPDARKQGEVPPPVLEPSKPKRAPKVPVVHPKENIDPVIKVDKKQQPPPPLTRQISTTSKRQAKSLNRALKGEKRDKKDPSLVLNTLDFAGQKIYRPMHHCFITRRSMYLVVFNLQDMMKYINSLEMSSSPGDLCPNPIEEVRYWIHSIHAHIYPPDEGVKDDERHRRVCLVGTHCHSEGNDGKDLTEEDLCKINEKLKNELDNDDRCVNHLHETTCTPSRLFTAVENSFSSNNPKSGAKFLKDRMITVTKHLEFLDEVYPISWLRFESHLMQLKQRKTCMFESDVKSEAKKKGIAEENVEDALTFFHDTGKLILLKRVSALFLREKQQEISDLVIINPKWLISAMQALMELPRQDRRFSRKEIKTLNEKGFAKTNLLKTLWSGSGSLSGDVVNQDKLCLVLQAYCLIFPLAPDSSTPDMPDHSSLEPGNSPNARSNEAEYLIPSRLPECSEENRKIASEDHLGWISFYFDFKKFLPIEIYHKLVCMFLAAFQPRKRSKTLFLSSALCRIDEFGNENRFWKLELESHKHRIKVSVRISDADTATKQDPSKCIQIVHSDFLLKICQDSGLQGLCYYGGPPAPCDCLQQPGVLDVVSYDPPQNIRHLNKEVTVVCPECLCADKKGRTVNQIMSDQVENEQPTSQSVLTITAVQNEFNLTDEQIDCPIKERDLFYLGGLFGAWRRYAGVPGLGLSDGEQHTIHTNLDLIDNAMKVKEALAVWRRNRLTATFRNLLNTVLELGDGDVAKKISEYVNNLK